MGDNMKKSTTEKFSTWTLWSPLKFAAISFCILISIAFIYSLIAGAIYTPATIPQTPLMILLALGFICSIALQINSLPRAKMDQRSFISIHNTQTVLLSGLFITSSYLVARYAQQIIFYLFMLETRLSATFIITLTTSLLFYLYLLGLVIANIYAKFRRIREFNVPTWKIICSMPFGFAALWTPGYIIKSTATKATAFTPKSKWMQRATNWICLRPANTIATFIAITTLSGFFFGFNAVLLTFSLTLVFGIWALQRGTKSFIQDMPRKYATASVIFNAALLAITIIYFAIPHTSDQDVQITISDTEFTTIQRQ